MGFYFYRQLLKKCHFFCFVLKKNQSFEICYYVRLINRGGINLSNNNLKRKPYFDPFIFKKVLEDVYLPPIARQILNTENNSHKQTFLFPNIRERFIPEIKKIVEDIDLSVKEEMHYQMFYEYEQYINPSDYDKQCWYDELREHYGLPIDYDFEEE